MEQKKERSIFRIVSIVYFVWMILYFSGTLILKATNLEYRMWVWTLGNCSLFLGLPVWLFAAWFRWHVRREGIRVLRIFVTVVFAGVFLIWSGFCFLAMLFAVQEEHRLFGGYVVVNRGAPLKETLWDLCKSRALFFREDADWDADFEIEYLKRKYHQEFVEVPFDKENMLFYDRYDYGYDRYGKTVPVSPAHPELPIYVSLAGREMEDDYTSLLTSWYIAEGCRKLDIDRTYEVDEYGYIHFWLYGEEDIKAAASDAQKLAAYAMQDEIYQDYHGVIRFLPEDAESIYETIYVYFGKMNWENSKKAGYEEDLSLLEESIREQYDEVLEERVQRREYEEERERMQAEAEKQREQEAAEREEKEKMEEAERLREEEAGIRVRPPFDEEGNKQESTYEKEARLILEEISESMDIEENFSAEYNARGEEYFLLGEDGTYQYTLVYNGDSENDACRIYVLFRSPFDAESGTYYYYTDTMTQIADTYAVVKGTGEIVASGKKSWGDAGSSEYREVSRRHP